MGTCPECGEMVWEGDLPEPPKHYADESAVQQDDGLYMHPACHQWSSVDAFYSKEHTVTLFCAECKKHVIAFKVDTNDNAGSANVNDS